MLIVFLLRKFSSETIKLSGASRRHVAFHPAAISTRARSFHREYANNVAFELDAWFGSADAATGICTSLMIVARGLHCWFGVPPRQLIESFIADWLDYRIEMVTQGSTSARPCSVPQ